MSMTVNKVGLSRRRTPSIRQQATLAALSFYWARPDCLPPLGPASSDIGVPLPAKRQGERDLPLVLGEREHQAIRPRPPATF